MWCLLTTRDGPPGKHDLQQLEVELATSQSGFFTNNLAVEEVQSDR